MSKSPRTDAAAIQSDYDPDDYLVDAELSRAIESELSEVEKAVNESGTAIGTESTTYSLPERVRNITAQRDYFMRQTDEARAALARETAK